jgi:hypothetical protein
MKITKLILFVSLIFLTSTNCILSEPAIITYLQNPSYNVTKSAEKSFEQEAVKKLETFSQKSPSKINKKIIKAKLLSNLPSIAGNMATYFGFLDYSNKDGRIAFPLRHTPANKAYILITEKIKLVEIQKNTIGYAEIEDEKKSQIYLYEKKKDENDMLYWHVKQTKTPKNKRINKQTITFLTKPKNIFIEEGDFLTTENKNLILPNNIYVVGNASNTKNLLAVLDFARFLEPIEFEVKKSSKNSVQEVITNVN